MAASCVRVQDGEETQFPHRVFIIIYPGFKPLEAVGPLSAFTYANAQLGYKAYDVGLFALEAGLIAADGPMALQASALPENDDFSDATVIVVGASDIQGALRHNPLLISWLSARCGSASRLAALCSGAFFFAEAGLLDDMRVTTHWRLAGVMARQYPKVTVDEDAIFLHQGRIWTSAGVTAAIDISLAFIEADHGRALAVSIAREMVVYLKRPGGQAQYSHALREQAVDHGVIADIRHWMLDNLDQALTLPGLAKRAAMSERSFSRLFRRETGQSPFAFLAEARLERARLLLEDSRDSIKRIALACGFGSDQELRRHFRHAFGISPSAYRERFATAIHAGSVF